MTNIVVEDQFECPHCGHTCDMSTVDKYQREYTDYGRIVVDSRGTCPVCDEDSRISDCYF